LKRLELQSPLDCSRQHALLAKIRAALSTVGLEPMMAAFVAVSSVLE
jgi:hypothetical protein